MATVAQTVIGRYTDAGNTDSVIQTPTGVNTAATGNTFVIGFTHDPGAGTVALTDNKGNTYDTSLRQGPIRTGNGHCQLYVIQNALGGSGHRWTITFPSPAYGVLFVDIISGSVSGIDAAGVVGRDGVTTQNLIVSTGTLTQADNLLCGIVGNPSGGTITTTSPTMSIDGQEGDAGLFWPGAIVSYQTPATTAINITITAPNPAGSFMNGQFVVLKAGAASGVTATLDLSDISDTISAVGAVAAAAELSQSDAVDPLSSQAQVDISSSLSQTDAADALDSSGSVGVSGVSAVLDQADAADSLTAAAGVSIAGSFSQSDATDDASSSASSVVACALSESDAADSLSGVASTQVSAAVAITDVADTISGVVSPTTGASGKDVDLQVVGTSPLEVTLATQASGSAFVVVQSGLVGNGDPTDNKSNTFPRILNWTPYTLFPSFGVEAYAATNATGGSNHVFQVAKDPTRTDEEATVFVCEVLSGATIQDVQVTQIAAGAALTSVAVTATGPATILQFWWGDNGGGPHTAVPDNGFSVVQSWLDGVSGSIQGAMAVRDVSSGTYQTTWTETPDQGAILVSIVVQGGSGASVGVVSVAGALSQSDSNDSMSSDTSIAVSGALAQSDSGDTLSADGSVPISGAITGELAQTDSLDTLVSSGAIALFASLAENDSVDSLSGAAVALVSAELSQSDSTDSVASSSSASISALLDQSDAADNAQSAASVAVAAEFQSADDIDFASSTTDVSVAADLVQSDAADTVLASGLVSIAGTISGTFDQIDQADSLSAIGVVLVGASGSILDDSDGLSSSASVAIAAVADILDQQDSMVADGEVAVAATRLATLVMFDGADSISADGSVSIGAVFARSDALDEAIASGAVFTVGQLIQADAADTVSASMVHFIPGRKLLPATTVAMRLNQPSSGIIQLSEVIAIGRPQE